MWDSQMGYEARIEKTKMYNLSYDIIRDNMDICIDILNENWTINNKFKPVFVSKALIVEQMKALVVLWAVPKLK